MEKFEAFSPESWAYAGQMTLLGMAMIFAVLGILWLVLVAFKALFASKKEVSEGRDDEKVAVQVPTEVVSVTQQSAISDDALAAVITAAIAAYMAEQGVSEEGFRVVSFRRADNTRNWNK